ncbi:PAS domain S-box protein [Anaerolineales bacterium HSG6]|nr:PAS domain S-box protein [Anaerolineales bacterium HSG6]
MNDSNKTKEQLLQELADTRTQLAAQQEAYKILDTRFKSFFQAAPMDLVLFDHDLRYINVSPSLAAINGKSIEEHLGKTMFEVLPTPEVVAQVEAPYRQVLETDQAIIDAPVSGESPGNPGELSHFLLSIFPVPSLDSEKPDVGSVILNVTEQKRVEEQLRASEEQYRSYFDAALIGLAITSPEKKWIDVNDHLSSIWGYSLDELREREITWIELTHPDDIEVDVAQFNRILAGEISEYNLEKRFICKDRAVIHAFIAVKARRAADGTIQDFVALVQDITERKNAEIEQKRLQNELISAQQSAIQELSTPIIPIMNGIIVLPLIGNLDSVRAKDLMRTMLIGISQHRAKIVILDITGVPIVDTGVAAHLDKSIQAARLKGARTILTGISDNVAETIIDLGIDWSNIETVRDLQTGLKVALTSLGLKLTV